jgi:hypothetical protein
MHTRLIFARARAEHARRLAAAALIAAAVAAPVAASAQARNWSSGFGDPRSAISSPAYPNAGTPRGDAALAAAARSSGWGSPNVKDGYKPNTMSRRSPYGVYGSPFGGRDPDNEIRGITCTIRC